MTATQKILLTATLLVALGGGLFEARVIFRQNAGLDDLQQRAARLERELASSRREREARTRELETALAQLADERAKTAQFAAADPAIEAALDAWLQNVIRLKQALEKTPSSQIPELQFLAAKDWLDATKENSLESEMDVRSALSQLRSSGKMRFSTRLFEALRRYLKANHDQPPADPVQLGPFFEAPVDPALLQRYGTFSTQDSGNDAVRFAAPDGSLAQWVIREKQPVDPYYDTTFQVGADGYGYGGNSQFDQEVNAAINAFRSAHSNLSPTDPAQLAPYLHSAIDPIFIRRRLDRKE